MFVVRAAQTSPSKSRLSTGYRCLAASWRVAHASDHVHGRRAGAIPSLSQVGNSDFANIWRMSCDGLAVVCVCGIDKKEILSRGPLAVRTC